MHSRLDLFMDTEQVESRVAHAQEKINPKLVFPDNDGVHINVQPLLYVINLYLMGSKIVVAERKKTGP